MSKINYQDIDVEEFLNKLGLHNIKRDGKEVFFSCPFAGHNHGDLNPSASMQIGTTRVHCFGCGFSGNALTFLAEYENCSPVTAARYIRQEFGDEFKEPEGSFAAEIEKRLNPKEEIKYKRNEPLGHEELAKRSIDWREDWKLQPYQTVRQVNYMFDRGFHWEALEAWNIGFDDISQRITIPWFDSNNQLIGFKGRALDEDVGNGNARYKVLGGPEYGFDTFDVSMMLFGMNMLKLWPNFHTTGKLIVREGEINVISMWQKEIGPTVGVSGHSLSDEQVYILNKFDVELVMYFDDLQDSLKAADKLRYVNRVSVMEPGEKDPADSTADEINHLLSRRESAIMLR